MRDLETRFFQVDLTNLTNLTNLDQVDQSHLHMDRPAASLREVHRWISVLRGEDKIETKDEKYESRMMRMDDIDADKLMLYSPSV